VHCYSAGVPRQMFIMPHQILQTPSELTFLHEVSHSYRIVHLDGRPHLAANIGLWQGDSIGRFEGNTLVVDTIHTNGRTRLDLTGNFLSDAAHIVERFTMLDANTIAYRATIDDPKVFTRPFTLVMPIARELGKSYEIFESACHEENMDLPHLEAVKEAAEKARK
jgi:hypothetical protein